MRGDRESIGWVERLVAAVAALYLWQFTKTVHEFVGARWSVTGTTGFLADEASWVNVGSATK